MELLIFLLLIPIARALIFFFDWRFIKKACEMHEIYLKGAGEMPTLEAKQASKNAADWITENTTEIKHRVEKAGLDNPVLSFMEPKGFGYVGQAKMTALDNLLFLNQEIQQNASTTLRRTRGHFKNQAIHSINPLFWLETLLYLPKAIISASGIDASSKLADTILKIIQIIYWIAIFVIVISKPELLRILIETVKK